MSIEDPRLSSIDNTSAADDFDSAVEQHLGYASETVGGIEVAQAETPDATRTDRLPAQTPPVGASSGSAAASSGATSASAGGGSKHTDQRASAATSMRPSGVVASASAAASTRSGRWKMLGLLFVCAAPVIASYFTYYVIRPEGRRNYGELIDPQRPLPAITGIDAQGRAVPLAALKDQWLLVSVADSTCTWLRSRGFKGDVAVSVLDASALRNKRWKQLARQRCN